MRSLINKKKKKGFTLIEMVAVVAIIGILAAILVPKITGYMKEAKKTGVIDQARKVTQAFETAEMKGKITKNASTGVYSVPLTTKVDDIADKTMLSLLDINPTAPTTNKQALQSSLDKLYTASGKIASIDECFDIVAGGEFTVTSDGKLIGSVENVVTK